jgi:hypothetical protein
MAQFYGWVQGSGGQASRCGGKRSGLTVEGNAWHVGVRAYLAHSEKLDEDVLSIYLTDGSGNGKSPRFLGQFVAADVDREEARPMNSLLARAMYTLAVIVSEMKRNAWNCAQDGDREWERLYGACARDLQAAAMQLADAREEGDQVLALQALLAVANEYEPLSGTDAIMDVYNDLAMVPAAG